MRRWWIGALAPMVLTVALGQELRLEQGQTEVGDTLRIEGAVYRVVELTEAGAWLEARTLRGMTGTLLGEKPADASRRQFVAFAGVPPAAREGGEQARTSLEVGARVARKAGESAQGLGHAAVKTVTGGPERAVGSKEQGDVRLPNRAQAVEALCARARALLARPDTSRKQVLSAFVEFEVELRRLGGDPPADPALRRELSAQLAEGWRLVDEFKRVSYARWSATIENAPARAMAELAGFRQRHAAADLQATGYAWVLLEESRRVWRERHLNLPEVLAGELPAASPELRALIDVRQRWRRLIGDAPRHELQGDLDDLDAALRRNEDEARRRRSD